ncbi:MAG: lamin tail domain-containing protein [bacterium]|nr:lamin tail domain-containing protein [bacterium]
MRNIARVNLVFWILVAVFPVGYRAGGEVVINEIMYNPPPGQGLDEEYEFVELYNSGSDAVDLTGWAFTEGIRFTFGLYLLNPGDYVVVCKNLEKIQSDYGIQNAVGNFEGRLENAGERLVLCDSSFPPQVVDEVKYGDELPWPSEADAAGSSLELISPDLDNGLFLSWGPSVSSSPAGTPGQQNSQHDPFAHHTDVVINEIMYHPLSAEQKEKFIEIVNIGTQEIPLDGWRLLGDASFDFSATASILPGEFVVIAADAKWMVSNYGLSKVFGGLHGLTSTGGQSVALRTPTGIIADYVDFKDNDPWPILPDGEGPSLELVNPYDDNDFGRNWADGSPPSPGRQNNAFSTNNAPYITKAVHEPHEPKDSDSVLITARVSDADGLSGVWVSYQAVLPGQYIRAFDAEYQTNWINISMNDAGQNGDVAAGDGVYSATLSPQGHRTLVRYVIFARDASAQQKIAQAPRQTDPSKNYAYFVYNGVPPYKADITYLGYPRTHTELTKLPVFHLVADSYDVLECEYKEIAFWDNVNSSDFKWRGTFVYEGEVYDHIYFRLRGGVHRYHQHKRAYKMKFNRGRRLVMKDNYGQPYPEKRKKLNLNSNIQQVWTGKRGEEGIYESLGFRLFRDAGVRFSYTTFVHLRIIDNVSETGLDQYKGDFYGLFTEVEQPDDNLLKTHGHPLTGNLYKMDTGAANGKWEKEVNDIPPLDDTDIQAFWDGYHGAPTIDWWRYNFNLESWYSYHAIVDAVHHTDIPAGKNYFYYRNPQTRLWEVFPWDLDLTFDVPYGGGEGPFVSRILGTYPEPFGVEYKNRLREILQLIYTEEHIFPIVDEWRNLIIEMAEADRDRWDQMPLPAPYPFQGRLEQTPWQNLFQTLDFRIAGLKSWIQSRRNTMWSWASDSNIPRKPVNIGPPDGATAPGIPLLVSSAFSDPNGDGHSASRWILIPLGRDWAYPFWDSGIAPTDKTSVAVPAERLVNFEWYAWRVKHRDVTGRWSEWSDPTSFQAMAISDPSPPTAPLAPTAQTPDYRTVILSWSPASDPDSGILGYEITRDGELLATGLPALSYTDATVEENTPYVYGILAINGAGTKSEPVQVSITTPQDDVAPKILSVEAIAQDTVQIVFDEPMNPESATNPANYCLSHWLSVKAVSLQPDGRTVELTTALMTSVRTYSLTVSNVADASSLRNLVAGGTTVLFTTRFEMEITDVTLRTGNAVALTGYAVGNYLYSDDLQYFIGSPIPEELKEGCIQMRLPNGPAEDRGDKSSDYLIFSVSFDVEVWVGFRINETLPAWLSDGTWEKTGFTQYVDKSGSSRYHDFYRNLFHRGEVVVGGNAQDPAGVHSNYIVVVRPLTPPNPDADGDNLPDEWEEMWFGNLSLQPWDDEDLDGWTNFEEFITGTSPIDSSSIFEVSAIRLDGGKVELRWPTSLHKYYQVYWASSPLEEWHPLGPPRDANAGAFVDEAFPTCSERYYRVEVW